MGKRRERNREHMRTKRTRKNQEPREPVATRLSLHRKEKLGERTPPLPG